MNTESELTAHPVATNQNESTCQSIEWYSEGQSRIVDVGGIQIEIRFVARKGRRSRISITAPAGAVFRTAEEGNFGFDEEPPSRDGSQSR